MRTFSSSEPQSQTQSPERRKRSLLSRYLSTGTSEHYSRFDNQVFRITNLLILTVLANTAGFLILSTLAAKTPLIAISAIAFFTYLSCHFMMRAHRQTVARVTLLLSGCAIVYLATAYTGFTLRLHLLFISISICALMVFNLRNGRMLVYSLTALPVVLLVVGDATNYFVPGIERLELPHNVLAFRIFSMLATLANIIAGVVYFHSQLAHSQREIEDYVAQLTRESQRQIQIHKMASLGEMAGGMAHEINSPLTVISIRAHQMKQLSERATDLPGLRTEITEGLDKILSTVSRISKIISSLRAFARLADQDPMEQVHVGALTNETLEFCRQRFVQSGVHLDIDVQEDLELACRPTQIVQVLLNLLNNAHDACLKQENARATLQAFRDGRDVVFRVRNNGPEIPEDVRPRIFEPFYTTKRPNLGTGLGLSISKGLVEDHDGTLECESAPGETVFQIRLPQQQMSGTA